MNPRAINLYAGATVLSTSVMLTPDMWTPSSNTYAPALPYSKWTDDKGNTYPLSIDSKHLEQLMQVYETCIHPTQYLPQLFNNNNCKSLLQAGTHISEIVRPLETYSTLGPFYVSQHCKYTLPALGTLYEYDN